MPPTDGRRKFCVDCSEKRSREQKYRGYRKWAAKNRERLRAYEKEYYIQNLERCRENGRRSTAISRAKNPELHRAKWRRWYWKDPARSRARERAKYARLQEQILLRAKQTRRLNIDLFLSRERREARERAPKRRAREMLLNMLERAMLTKNAQQEWRTFPQKKRREYRSILLERARELGVVTPAIEEKLYG